LTAVFLTFFMVFFAVAISTPVMNLDSVTK